MWLEDDLENMADIVSGGTPSRDISEYWNGQIPWVTPTDITKCKTNYLSKTEEKITEQGLTKSSAKMLPAGAILLTSRATVGEARLATTPCCTNQGFKSLVAKKHINNVFLFYQVTRNRHQFERYAVGSTFLEINKKDTSRVRLEYPEDPYLQKKIADILEKVDFTIEKTEELIAKYEKIKQGMMHDLFTRGVDENGKLRPSYEDAPELYQDSVLGKLPNDWRVDEVGNLITKMTNGFVGVATPHYVNENQEGVLYLYGNNIRENRIEIDKVLKVSKNFHLTQGKSQLKEGDLLTVQSGHIGVSAVVPKGFAEANCHALIITRFIDAIDPEFMSYYINSALGMKRFEPYFVGSTIKHVNVKEFKELPVPILPIDEQLRIKKAVSSVYQNIKRENQCLNKLKNQKAGLMQDLLTGQVSVNVEQKEAA